MKKDIRELAFHNLNQNLAQSIGSPEFKERQAQAQRMHDAEQERIRKAEAKRLRRAKRGQE